VSATYRRFHKKGAAIRAAQGSDAPPGDGAIITKAAVDWRRCDLCHFASIGLTGALELKITLRVGESDVYSRPALSGWPAMDTLSLREKAALCLRIASRLSWNNPSRLQLTDLAGRFERQAKEIELQNHRAQQDGMLAADAGVNRS
jgi:hypothetical protein